jgi:hypothetical protein
LCFTIIQIIMPTTFSEFGTSGIFAQKNAMFTLCSGVFAFLNLPFLPSRGPSCQILFDSLRVFSVGLMTSHARHQSTNMAVRDATCTGFRYGEANWEQIAHSKNTHKSNTYTVKLVYDYCMSKEYDKEFMHHSPINSFPLTTKRLTSWLVPNFTRPTIQIEYMCRKIRKDGKGQIRHKKAVEKGDVQKLYSNVILIYRQG